MSDHQNNNKPEADDEALGDRRPLASRDTNWAHKATAMLAKTSIQPNQVSIGSIVFAGIAGLLFYVSGHVDPSYRWMLWLLAALACQFRLLCNLFDGMLAVEAGRKSADGLAWNEFPDRYADILIMIGIGYGIGFPSLGWAAACFSVLTAYTRELGNAVGAGADFIGPMAKQHRMAVITAASVLAAVTSFFDLHPMIAVGALLTSIRRSHRLLNKLNESSH